jgi:hypothetical protein
MTHLPYVLSCYALGVLVPVVFGIAALVRMRAADRKLAAIDPRRRAAGRMAAKVSA